MTNEELRLLSELLDSKLDPIKQDISCLRADVFELRRTWPRPNRIFLNSNRMSLSSNRTWLKPSRIFPNLNRALPTDFQSFCPRKGYGRSENRSL